MLLGDFNARTSKSEDYISNEGSDHIHDTSEKSFQPLERQSFDPITNNHGKQPIEICKNTDLRILNGRTKGDSLGRPTFHGKNGTSLIDYIICSQNLLQNVKYLVVKAPSYLSDHSQVVTWVELYTNLETNEDIPSQPPTEKLPLQYIWTDDSNNAFIKELKSNNIQSKLNTFLNNDYSNDKESINEFQNIILEASKKSLKIKIIKYRHKINNVANKKWFDKECRIKRHQLRKVANQKHRDPNNNEIRISYHTALKEYKNTLEMKKNKFHQERIQELEKASKDPISIWKILKTSTDDLNFNETKKMPLPSEWLTHFETLHSEHKSNKEQEKIIEYLENYEKIKHQFNELDGIITDSEL